MQGYNNGSERPFIPVHHNGQVEASIKAIVSVVRGSIIPVHYNG
jgi:hypothetical protein